MNLFNFNDVRVLIFWALIALILFLLGISPLLILLAILVLWLLFGGLRA